MGEGSEKTTAVPLLSLKFENPLPVRISGRQSFGDPEFDNVADNAPISFEKGQFVSEYTFQKNTDTVVARHVGRSYQHRLLRDPEMCQERSLSENVEMSRCRN